MGHFHPTESVADKISPILLFSRELLLHVSRGVRWDSDHVVTLNDEVKAVAAEVARAGAWDRVHVATDYFDASINRVAAWVIGARATLKAILMALLEPTELLKKEEAAGNLTARLALMEEVRDLPYAAVWNRYCAQQGVPAGAAWLDRVTEYERIGPLQEALEWISAELIEVSRFYGRGNDFAIAGGGNTSVKDGERMAIKASGAGLRDITEAGFVELSRAAVREILARTYSDDPLQREAEIKARPHGQPHRARRRGAALRGDVPARDARLALRRAHAPLRGQRAHLRARRRGGGPRAFRRRGPLGALHGSRLPAGEAHGGEA